ncbi:MAG: ABC transporter permease [Planctomycetes bacterium]|nr:ABC transporter permease [Planctomycetota bacterium]
MGTSSPRAVDPGVPRSRFRRTLQRSRGAWVGGVIVAAFLLVAVAAPLLPGWGPHETDAQFLGAGAPGHPLGTDAQGRDKLARLLHGSRYSLGVALLAVGVSLAGGAAVGAVAAFRGGATDFLLMRLVDVLMAFPHIVLALAVMAALDRSLVNLGFAVGVAGVPLFARQVRAQVMAEMTQDYVTAARAAGVGGFRLLTRDILPNAAGPVVVLCTLGVGTAILDSAALNFIGLGPDPRLPEWGTMLKDYWDKFGGETQAVGLIACAVAIALVTLGFNLLGDALRDAIDPRTGP